MAKKSQPWDLNPILEAFQKAMEGKTTDENFDELSLRVKDLNGLFKDLIQFFKTQGLYNKELGDTIKKAIEFEKTQTKSRKGQGISQDTALLYLNQEISKLFSLSVRGQSKAFDANSQNDLIKAMKENLSAYDKLVNSINDLQKAIADSVNSLGGKLGKAMGGSSGGTGGKKSPWNLFGKGDTKDPDLKSASPKGNPFMNGIKALIGFLGNKSSEGFLGRLKNVISEFFVKAGFDVLKLAAYGILSLARNFGLSVLKPLKWLTMGGEILFGGAKRGATKGISTAVRALSHGKGIEEAIKLAGKGSKVGFKAGTKSALKKVPGIGAVAGVAFGAARWASGDKEGAVAEVISGLAPIIGSLFGPLGTAVGMVVSTLIDIGLAVRDFFHMKEKGDKSLGKSLDGLSEGIEDKAQKDKEREEKRDSFWQKVMDWFKDHWPFKKGGDDKGSSQYTGPQNYSTPGNLAARSFSERVRNAESYVGTHFEELSKMDSAKRDKLIEEKFGVIKKGYSYQDAWAGLVGDKLQEALNNADISSREPIKGVNVIPPKSVSSAVMADNIGVGQTYSVSSVGGSSLGDAFLGGSLARISTGGGFGGKRGHKGIDLPYPEGTTVRAFLPGKVVNAEWHTGFGKTIGIRDTNGMLNIYGHLSSYSVSKGQEVARGQEIGRSGHTGFSVTGNKPGSKVKPHLHFEIRPSMARGGSVDPVSYVASALGYSVDSMPDSGDMFANSSVPSENSRTASEPKGIYNEENVVASSGGEEGSTSIADELRNAYANNGFDQTGNTQFLAAINSIRVQLGKYQQIGMVV